MHLHAHVALFDSLQKAYNTIMVFSVLNFIYYIEMNCKILLKLHFFNTVQKHKYIFLQCIQMAAINDIYIYISF